MIPVNTTGCVIVDLDTGTILHSNVVALNINDLDRIEQDAWDNDQLSDSEIIDLAREVGKTIYV